MSYPWQRDRSDATNQEPDITEHDAPQPGAADLTETGELGPGEASTEAVPDPGQADHSSRAGQPVEGSFLGSLAAPPAEPDEAPPHTGDPAVDAALAGAAAAQAGDPAEQLEVYVGTHRALQERLADSGA